MEKKNQPTSQPLSQTLWFLNGGRKWDIAVEYGLNLSPRVGHFGGEPVFSPVGLGDQGAQDQADRSPFTSNKKKNLGGSHKSPHEFIELKDNPKAFSF